MAGPAIRAWEIAQALAGEHDVQLTSTVRCDLEHADFPVSHVGNAELRRLVSWSEIVIFQGHVMDVHPWMRRTDRVLVADIYDPFHLEILEQMRGEPAESRLFVGRLAVDTLNRQLARGDYFLCASAKQRDFWLGQLAGIGRINPATYDDDENLETLIGIVPFGIQNEPPRHTRQVLKGVVDGIGPDDKVVLWGGGVYNWFDPITLIHAIDRLRARVPTVRLFFLGMSHPNPKVPAMEMAARARQLAEELGLVGSHVFFNESWVDYDDRQNYLLEADVGVSTHLRHVETAFSFRTRILDYLWASVPIVATDGDSFAEIIEREGFGITVPPGDVDALERGLYELLSDDDRNGSCRHAISAGAAEYRWSRALEPLFDFCRNARRAPDLVIRRQRAMIGTPSAGGRWLHRGWRRTIRVTTRHLVHGEFDQVIAKAQKRLRVKTPA
jgi:glycosyltransferase involved in cell wall biosynthesis